MLKIAGAIRARLSISQQLVASSQVVHCWITYGAPGICSGLVLTLSIKAFHRLPSTCSNSIHHPLPCQEPLPQAETCWTAGLQIMSSWVSCSEILRSSSEKKPIAHFHTIASPRIIDESVRLIFSWERLRTRTECSERSRRGSIGGLAQLTVPTRKLAMDGFCRRIVKARLEFQSWMNEYPFPPQVAEMIHAFPRTSRGDLCASFDLLAAGSKPVCGASRRRYAEWLAHYA